MVVASLALLLVLGGTGVAAVSQLVPRNSVGTAQLRNDAVNSKKVKDGSLRSADFRAGQIPAGPQGPQGATGPAGAAGPTGPTGPAGSVTKLTAVVNSSGSIARSQGTTSAGRTATGQYEVIFNQNVTQCTYNATLGNPASGVPPAGSIVVASRSGQVNGVFVGTYNATGTATDRSFHLVVVC
jgi:hypothetical protein